MNRKTAVNLFWGRKKLRTDKVEEQVEWMPEGVETYTQQTHCRWSDTDALLRVVRYWDE